MVMSQEKTLLPEYLPQQIRRPGFPTAGNDACNEATRSGKRPLDFKREAERKAIQDALRRHNGNQTAAARELGISRVTLWRKKTMYHLS